MKKEWKSAEFKYCPRCGRKNTIVEWAHTYKCTECGEFGDKWTIEGETLFWNILDTYCRENRTSLMKSRDKEKIVTALRYSLDRNLRNKMLIKGEKPIFLSEVIHVDCPKCGKEMKITEYAYRGDVSKGDTIFFICEGCFSFSFQETMYFNSYNERLKVDVSELEGHKSVYPFRWATSDVYG